MSDLFIQVMVVIIFVFGIGFVASAQYKNGRISMCSELGNKYLIGDKCVSEQEYLYHLELEDQYKPLINVSYNYNNTR